MKNQTRSYHYNISSLISWAFLAIILTHLLSCSNDELEPKIDNLSKSPYFKNNPLAINADTLRILAIGNSYSWDGTAYLQELLDSAHIDRKRYCVYLLTRGNTSLEYWRNTLYSGENCSMYRMAGDVRGVKSQNHTVQELLSQNWDIVVLQQFSKYAIDYDSYNPYLQNLIKAIRTYCENPNVCIAWQLIHSYGKGYERDTLTGYNRWVTITKATKEMVQKDGIDVIIPTGTAIQQARETELETPYDLTRDNTHLCYGVGRYIAACCWMETLFKPSFGVSIKGNTANHPLTESELNDSEMGFIPASSVPVTDQNRDLCQQCALDACTNPYEIHPKGNTTSILNVKK